MENLFYLLIFCGVLCQVILGSITDEDIRKPSDVLVRHKRVFHSRINEDVARESVHPAPYVVNIKIKHESYEVNHCVGSILKAHVIITAAQCANHEIEEYSIYSQTRHSHNGTYHIVTKKKVYFSSPRQRTPNVNGDGIALMFVYPHFTLSSSSGAESIALRYNIRPVRPNSLGIISGWGYRCSEIVLPERIVLLQSIYVKTLDNADCHNLWQGLIQISSKDICTFDASRHCGHTDLGAPLVIDRQLVGIHIISPGFTPGVSPKPDIFAYLDHAEYFEWIRANIHE